RPFDALGVRGETILELRSGEAVLERIAGGRMRIGSECCSGRRLAALGEQYEDGEESHRAPSGRHAKWHRQTGAIMRRRFRIGSDHPPLKNHRTASWADRRLDDVKNPEQTPHPDSQN